MLTIWYEVLEVYVTYAMGRGCHSCVDVPVIIIVIKQVSKDGTTSA
jgi:hypothetical protein